MSLRQQNILCKKLQERTASETMAEAPFPVGFSSTQVSRREMATFLSSVAATPLLTLDQLLPDVGKSAAGLGRQRFACVG